MMAEVTVGASVTTETDEGHVRRVSTRNFDDQSRVPKSRSCHDSCKHGIKSVPETKVVYETKVRRSLQRRNSLNYTGKTAKTCEVIKKEVPEFSKKVTVSLRRQTSLPADLKSSLDKNLKAPKPKTSSLAASQRLRRRQNDVNLCADIGNGYTSRSEVMGASDEQSIDFRKKPKQLKSDSPLPARQLMRRHSDIMIPRDSVGGISNPRNSEKKWSKENCNMQNNKNLVRERFSLSPASTTKWNLSTQYGYMNRSKKVPSTLANRKRIKEVEGEQPTSEDAKEKTLYAIEPQAENQAVGLENSGSFSLPPYSEEKSSGYGERTMEASHLSPTEKSLPSNMQVSLSLSNLQSSTSSSSEAMQSDENAFDIDNSEIDNPISNLDVENMRTSNISSEDRDWILSQKLQFRNGNLIDVQFENRSPSLLKFWHREVLAENQNGISDTRGRSLRKMLSNGALYQPILEPVTVALKHQDTEIRRDTQGLFNDVIEETANKLVQSRKSKVKALVGAFEAVFGQQDSKFVETNST